MCVRVPWVDLQRTIERRSGLLELPTSLLGERELIVGAVELRVGLDIHRVQVERSLQPLRVLRCGAYNVASRQPDAKSTRSPPKRLSRKSVFGYSQGAEESVSSPVRGNACAR